MSIPNLSAELAERWCGVKRGYCDGCAHDDQHDYEASDEFLLFAASFLFALPIAVGVAVALHDFTALWSFVRIDVVSLHSALSVVMR